MRPDTFREQFTSLADTTHLASCSQGAVADRVKSAMGELAYSLRADGAPWARWMAEVERLREQFAGFLNAAPGEIALVPSATHAAFQVISAQNLGADDAVVSMAAEFPSVGQVLRAASDAEVRWVTDESMRTMGVVEAYRERIDGRTRLVSVPLALYTDGSVQPVNEIARHARAVGARVLVDAYQCVGVLPVDVQRLDCDYLITGTLKYLLGLPGIAALFARSGVADRCPPRMTGWFGRVDPFAFDPESLDVPEEARRFESGTPAVPAVYAAHAGMEVLGQVPAARRWQHVGQLVTEARERLVDAGERLSTPAPDALPGPQVAVFDDDPGRLASFLSEYRVVTAPRGRLLRVAFHYYNTPADIDRLLHAVSDYRRQT